MKKYDLLLLALYAVLLTVLFVGVNLHLRERQEVRDYMTDLQKKKINVVVIEDTKLNFKLTKKSSSNSRENNFALLGTSLKFKITRESDYYRNTGDFQFLGTSLLLENVSDFQIQSDTLFIGKKAMGNLHELVLASHVQVDLLDDPNISIGVTPNLK